VLKTVLDNAQDKPNEGVLSMVIGVVLLLFGATTVFAELQTTLNRLWGVRAKPRSALTAFVRVRLQSLAVLLGTAFLLLASLLLTSSIAALQSSLPSAGVMWVVVDTAISIAVLTFVFAMLYKYVPDAQIRWRFTWFGAALTAVLFTIGKLGIGLYLGQASVGSAYGAAGSVVVLMVWVYYAALIFFFGAVATRKIAEWNGAPVEPTEFAEHIRNEPTSESRGDDDQRTNIDTTH
jgi:membrane protein